MKSKKWVSISVPVEFAEMVEIEAKKKRAKKKQILLDLSDFLFTKEVKKNVKSNSTTRKRL